MFSYNLSHTIFWNINLDKTCIAAWLVDLFPTGCLFISFGMAPKYVLEWTMGLLTAKGTNKQLFWLDFHELDAWTPWNALADMFFHCLVCIAVLSVSEFPWEIFFLFCRRELQQRKSFTRRRRRKRQRRYLLKHLLLDSWMLKTPQMRCRLLK